MEPAALEEARFWGQCRSGLERPSIPSRSRQLLSSIIQFEYGGYGHDRATDQEPSQVAGEFAGDQ